MAVSMRSVSGSAFRNSYSSGEVEWGGTSGVDREFGTGV